MCPAISEVEYSYPNKHYMYVAGPIDLIYFYPDWSACSPVNLSPFKLENGTGYEGHADVFHPVADPSGLIQCTVVRK